MRGSHGVAAVLCKQKQSDSSAGRGRVGGQPGCQGDASCSIALQSRSAACLPWTPCRGAG